MPYVEKKIISGEILEIERYFSPKGNNSARKEKKDSFQRKADRR